MTDEQSVRVTRREVISGAAASGLVLGVGLAQPLFAETADKRLPAPDYVSDDKFFGKAFIDIDEWRDKPVRFRYVHGGFEGTDARFSFYLPEKAQYKQRFFHTLQGGTGGSENTVLDAINAYNQFGVVAPQALLAAFDCGGYLIESNQGHFGDDLTGVKNDHTILCYRTSVQTAKFAKQVAQQMYGAAPQHGYLYGGSGGAVRTINCLESVKGIWDAGVPFVCPHESSGTFFSIQANAVRLLGRDKLAMYNDAVEVGGSGNPFQGLDNEQADALKILYKTGHSRRIGLDNPVEQVLVWSYAAWDAETADPTYWDDFWTKPGYLGHDSPRVFEKDRVQFKSRVKRLLTLNDLKDLKLDPNFVDELGMGPQAAFRAARANPRGPNAPIALVLEDRSDKQSRLGCSSVIFSGAAQGRERFVFAVLGDVLLLGGNGKELLEGVKVGDEITIDNRKYLSFCYQWQHQVEPKFREWAHSVVDGRAIYPQRPKMKRITAMYPHSYDVGTRKIMIVENLMDRGTWPSSAASIQEQYKKVRGEQWLRDNFRIYYNDHAWHGTVTADVPGIPAPVLTTKLIDYQGILHRALRDMVAWVEQGKAPPPSTHYEYTMDCDIQVPATAEKRLGLQPVATLAGNGKENRVEVKAGQPVQFVTRAEVPPNMGMFVKAEIDFDGTGAYPYKHTGLDGKSSKLEFQTSHTYDKPGTYYACARVASQPEGDTKSPLYNAINLARIRVVVT